MSKKDYAAEAAAINELLVPYMPAVFLMQFIGRRCDAHKASNDLFDRERFIAACLRGLGAPYRKEER